MKRSLIVARIRLLASLALLLTFYFGQTSVIHAAHGAGAAAGAPSLPEVKTAQDLPRRAEVGPARVDLLNDIDSEESAVVGSLAAGAKVFILRQTETHANVLTAVGQFGWVDNSALTDIKFARDQDFRRIADAIGNRAVQAALDPAQQQLFQATFAAWFAGRIWGVQEHGTDSAKIVKQELEALALVRSRQIKLALPVLLARWDRRFLDDAGYAAYDYAEDDPVRIRAESHFLLRELFPRVKDALGTPDDTDRLLCRQFGKDESSGIAQYTFGRNSAGSNNIFILPLIKQIHLDKPPADCLVTALKKIAATNSVAYRYGYRPGDVEMAVELLAKAQSKAQLEKWLSEIAKQPVPRFGGNLALALIVLKEVEVAPHVDSLMFLAEGKNASEGEPEFDAQRMALWALGMRAPSRRVDALMRTLLLDKQTHQSIRADALRILARKPAAPGVFEALAKVLNDAVIAQPSRVRQLAVETLASDSLRHKSLPILRESIADSDPYIGSVALTAVRNETLRAMKAAPSASAREKIRGGYLESLRKHVESLSSLPPDLKVRRSPLWMLKPQARVSIELRREPELNAQALPIVHIGTPWLEPRLPRATSLVPYPDSEPRLQEEFAVHPGQVLFKYGATGREKTVTIALSLDELAIDGVDLVARAQPGIYTVELVSPDGGTEVRVAWYCEPDNAFWSEAAFEGEGGE